MLSVFKELLPRTWRQMLKRRLYQHQDMYARMENLRRAGFLAKGAVDVGAFEGSWTRECQRVWPGLRSIMVEPLVAKRPVLQRLADRVPGSQVVSKALGREEGEVVFRLSETNSGIVPAGLVGGESVTIPCARLDDVISEIRGPSHDLLKLDVQGHELEVLRGGPNCLASAEVIILEISVLRIGEVPIFREVDEFMGSAGFRLYDLIPQYYRPRDGALWQIDGFYVPEASPLIASRSWA